MSFNSLPLDDIKTAVQELLQSPTFRDVNKHLTSQNLSALQQQSFEWPENQPVYFPQKGSNTAAYEITVNDEKYPAIQVIYRQYTKQDIPQDGEVSHLVYIGDRTTRNINPKHLTVESHVLSQTRTACFLYMQYELRERYLGLQHTGPTAEGHVDETEEEFEKRVVGQNIGCRTIHRKKGCRFDWDEWVRDWEEQMEGAVAYGSGSTEGKGVGFAMRREVDV